MAIARPMTKEDKKWQAQEDARTLARALEIKTDSSRKKAAVAAAKTLAREAEKEASRFKKAGK